MKQIQGIFSFQDCFRFITISTVTIFLGPIQPLCCDKEQQEILKQQMNIARDFLSRCPSCYSNFVHFWCTFACSVKQKQFVIIKNEKSDEHSRIHDNLRESYATDVDVYMTKKYAEKIFDSCKDVK